MDPSAVRAMETPSAIRRPGDEQRPAWASRQLDAVRELAAPADIPITGTPQGTHMDAALRDLVLDVFAAQQNGAIRPRMIVQCAVVIAAQEQVDIGIQEAIARQQIPAQQIRVIVSADHAVRRIAVCPCDYLVSDHLEFTGTQYCLSKTQ